MNISGIDWHYMKSTLIIVGISVITSGVLVFLSIYHYSQLEQQYLQKNREYRELQLMSDDARKDEQIIKQYLNRFRELENTGVFEKTQRVEWVDAVNNARKNMKLPIVRYHLFPAVVYEADYLLSEGYASVIASQVNLEAGLLHEGDLVDLFHWMELYAPGQLHVSECTMKRSRVTLGYFADSPNLTVTCKLLWFTLKPINPATDS